ncbi:MAG: PmbA/TldA family metallopeptidase, partial [Polyangiales bacterium]
MGDGGDDGLLEVLRAGLERGGEKEAEVSGHRARRGLARFANNQLGQHVDLGEVHITVRVARDGRVASATTDLRSDSSNASIAA